VTRWISPFLALPHRHEHNNRQITQKCHPSRLNSSFEIPYFSLPTHAHISFIRQRLRGVAGGWCCSGAGAGVVPAGSGPARVARAWMRSCGRSRPGLTKRRWSYDGLVCVGAAAASPRSGCPGCGARMSRRARAAWGLDASGESPCRRSCRWDDGGVPGTTRSPCWGRHFRALTLPHGGSLGENPVHILDERRRRFRRRALLGGIVSRDPARFVALPAHCPWGLEPGSIFLPCDKLEGCC